MVEMLVFRMPLNGRSRAAHMYRACGIRAMQKGGYQGVIKMVD